MSKDGKYLFTSESVTEGHPDKICDQISDSILDDLLAQDPMSRVACETMVTTGLVLIAGEISSQAYCDFQRIVRKTVQGIGYTTARYGFDYETCSVLSSIHDQSPDISMGVDESESHEQGAGDQGLMFGYACNDTEELMPMPIMLAHKLVRQLSKVRREKTLTYLRPDGKSQVTVEYFQNKPVRVDAVVIAAQHNADVDMEVLRDDIKETVIRRIIPANMLDKNTKIYINETGRFELGGPFADTGLTGRKIIVDTYGGVGSHGGGCFSGKDPSKVDRSGSYMARYVAKNLVAAGLADRLEVQLAYAIGVPHPVSIMVDTFGTSTVDEDKIKELIRNHFDLTPKGMIKTLDLLRPIYRKSSYYGHFGRHEPEFTWEKTDKADAIRRDVKL
ncbi:MAG: methionine adenosyltransferase [Acidobacteria bacterium]|nr:methionine adenosyltransferase [Acidobacteriota bacterium]MCG2815629.1 methionine adenosyltransferase [Candidatus Aminicenantes bacterium]MBU1338986.1 methionine adenosyltransferase [Acidobacteriota bacterium]MBU1474916.1 methionine adenosyltransferase [Acidobacteriota bacterium]MBU4253300.1 methionine adenosyltransferase [Acidobacteriota bacterium]